MIRKNIILMYIIVHFSLFAQDSTVVKIFDDNIILFGYVQQEGIIISDNGQTISRKVELPKFTPNCEIYAKIEIEKNLENGDPWDRAGTILLSNGLDPDIEILKFMTAYAVPTNHRLNVSDLCSLLQGEVEIKAHIPSNPDFIGFRIIFELVYYEKENVRNSDWAKGIFFNNSLEKKHIENYLTSTNINIPAGLEKVNLYYYTSGHCTDGRGADEFESKDWDPQESD